MKVSNIFVAFREGWGAYHDVLQLSGAAITITNKYGTDILCRISLLHWPKVNLKLTGHKGPEKSVFQY